MEDIKEEDYLHVPSNIYPQSMKDFIGNGLYHTSFIEQLPLDVFVATWNALRNYLCDIKSVHGIVRTEGVITRVVSWLAINPADKATVKSFFSTLRRDECEYYVKAALAWKDDNGLKFYVARNDVRGLCSQYYTNDYKETIWILMREGYWLKDDKLGASWIDGKNMRGKLHLEE